MMNGSSLKLRERLDLVEPERSEAQRSEVESSAGPTKPAAGRVRVMAPTPRCRQRAADGGFRLPTRLGSYAKRAPAGSMVNSGRFYDGRGCIRRILQTGAGNIERELNRRLPTTSVVANRRGIRLLMRTRNCAGSLSGPKRSSSRRS